MAKLKNIKHELFCKTYVKCSNQTEAYKKAYGDKKSAEANASRLMANDGILKRVKELQERASDSIDIDIANVLNFADKIRQKCLGAPAVICEETEEILEHAVKPDFTNALKANEQVARIIGAFNDRLKVELPQTIEQLINSTKR